MSIVAIQTATMFFYEKFIINPFLRKIEKTLRKTGCACIKTCFELWIQHRCTVRILALTDWSIMNKKSDIKPYIPPESNPAELTVCSCIAGIILAVIFGAANAYLGLKVGLTVSASIPAAVIAMGTIRIIMKRNSILESNMVQTIGSAGESVAAGAIFTLPTLFLWAAEGKIAKPTIGEITFIALAGGILGVLFMIPLRSALIAKEHHTLPYPEGKACAEVLLSGEKNKENSKSSSTVFAGMGIGGLVKFVVDGLGAFAGEISLTFKGFRGEIGTQIYPAVMSVGYICGPKISAYMLSGGIMSWLVLIPIIALFGNDAIIYPGSKTIGEIYASGKASAIWSTYIRYIGAGALAAGGIISLAKSLPLIVSTFKSAVGNLNFASGNEVLRTEKDLSIKWIIVSVVVICIVMGISSYVPIGIFGSLIIIIFGFFFSTVSSKMVGLVGSSNNPVSGMAIATLIIATLMLTASGKSGMSGMYTAIVIGAVICIIAAIAGDSSQDLKTGYLLGATPKKQQIGELIGAICSALTIGATLYLLDAAWGFGSDELSAPQATLMKLIVEGVVENNLPWGLILSGVFIAVLCELSQIPILPFAIGIYLPVHISACIMVGGIVRFCFEKLKKDESRKTEIINNGTLFCSGLIAGEGLGGVILAALAVMGVSKYMNISHIFPPAIYYGGSVIIFALSVIALIRFALRDNLYSKQSKRSNNIGL